MTRHSETIEVITRDWLAVRLRFLPVVEPKIDVPFAQRLCRLDRRDGDVSASADTEFDVLPAVSSFHALPIAFSRMAF